MKCGRRAGDSDGALADLGEAEAPAEQGSATGDETAASGWGWVWDPRAVRSPMIWRET